MNQNNQFKENYHGILGHDGWIKVAKFNITAKVLNIDNKGQILVKGYTGKGSYLCKTHKNLKADIKFLDVGDTVGIKWNLGNPYVVGFRKAGYDTFAGKPTGDFPVHESGKADWLKFFKGIDAE